MFKITKNLETLRLTVQAFEPNPCNLQTVRWGRKPPWLPMAKSKIFKIRPRIRIPQEETDEIKRLYNNYRTEIKSINKYLTEKFSSTTQQQIDEEQHRRVFEEDFAKCMKINEEWNSRVKTIREEHTQEELKRSIAQARSKVEEYFRKQQQKLEEAEEIVRREKETSKDFITPEKLDAAIDYAVNNPVDYNHSLTTTGDKIWGRETAPQQKETVKEKVSIKQ